jgi:hypothetical protein
VGEDAEEGVTWMAVDPITEFPADLKAEIAEALDDLDKGIRRPEKIAVARRHMDRVREENRILFGESDIAVQLIRNDRELSPLADMP